jgi:hypothetical protein
MATPDQEEHAMTTKFDHETAPPSPGVDATCRALDVVAVLIDDHHDELWPRVIDALELGASVGDIEQVTERSPEQLVEQLEMWAGFQCAERDMTPERHDAIVALVRERAKRPRIFGASGWFVRSA